MEKAEKHKTNQAPTSSRMGVALLVSKRFERLALALNALYPEGSNERRMLEGVQAAMRGIR